MKYIISIKPKYSKLIFKGLKRSELRRTRIFLRGGLVLFFVYESAPTQVLVGYFVSSKIYYASLEELWEREKGRCAVGRGEFLEYFSGKLAGTAIQIDECHLFGSCITLNEIREIIPSWHPPQNYMSLSNYLKYDAFISLIKSRMLDRHLIRFFPECD